jgi:hypothetical protein
VIFIFLFVKSVSEMIAKPYFEDSCEIRVQNYDFVCDIPNVVCDGFMKKSLILIDFLKRFSCFASK